ncbi:hypothetical protein F5876DRAFT_91204 [Lentinula aff. lateritia]|uniref:Uncharacterized protein n=1 Tax=Lentinula aff. lateritia TaxID=2804960 RepID=A0ACC1TNN0_9AGAR|nr:hypothetical protein F5876DRAFT_91204 [Lentinula aff. lateritia]
MYFGTFCRTLLKVECSKLEFNFPLSRTLPVHRPVSYLISGDQLSGRASTSTVFGLQPIFSPDIALVSVDAVIFYVHSHVVLGASNNAFRSLIPSTPTEAHPVIHVPESSTTLNIILHAVYHMPFSQHYSFEDLSTAVNQLHVYGVPPKLYVSQDTHLFKLLLSYAPTLPLKVYTLAAKHNLLDLAVATSSHLLSFDLSNLTEETAEAIGSEYLRRLFFLHMGRLDALKRLLSSPPNSHPPTADCNAKDLTRAWALASAYLAWDLRPDLSTNLLASTLIPLERDISCNLCKEHLHLHIKELSVQWSHVKVIGSLQV